ncbi:uncharacterized protein SPSK_04708 [Sporothrix schenckii 1099-18]|uniref:Uncharacterized protein n=1 Tax=Sporothrix schenckii 1099-18 TaxID=1397361 RepID=A0A0F2M2K7_SPOSC|nr:uncharacterized protein SPSK_04708 [Sporothrix schenckii 1099-18]KJR82975.1 hypothetical protein SPSK_04708 [Sporothrix schenckii 1099-18]
MVEESGSLPLRQVVAAPAATAAACCSSSRRSSAPSPFKSGSQNGVGEAKASPTKHLISQASRSLVGGKRGVLALEQNEKDQPGMWNRPTNRLHTPQGKSPRK